MRKWGGYKISNTLKQMLLDIYRQAMIGLDLVATSDGLSAWYVIRGWCNA